MGRSVLIVDDQAGFRLVARELLEADGFDVVGEAGDADGAFAAVDELHPEIVVLDVRLPGRSGLQIARELADRDDAPAVVLISTADYARSVEACGARAFIPKAALSGRALRVAVDGS